MRDRMKMPDGWKLEWLNNANGNRMEIMKMTEQCAMEIEMNIAW